MGDGVVVMPRQGGMVGGREAWAEARGETLISSAGEEFEMQGNMKGIDEDVANQKQPWERYCLTRTTIGGRKRG